jgi:chemotaxis response regulator CheB
MPKAAINEGSVDLVLPLSQMARVICRAESGELERPPAQRAARSTE